jgi:hypothetical protein
MERESIAVQNVKDLQANGKRWLEEILGQPLSDHQQVFIMVFTPSVAPSDESRQRARLGLEAIFQKTEAYAREHQVSDDEIDAAIEEAMAQVRPRKD